MNELLESGLLGQQILWGVKPWQLGVALLLVLLGFLGKRIINFLFEGTLRRYTRATNIQWDDDVIELLPAPLGLVIHVLCWYAAVVMLSLPVEPVNLRNFVFQGLMVALAVAVTWVFFRLLDVVGRVMERLTAQTDTRLDDQLVPLLRKTLKVFLGIIIAISVIQQLGYSITSLIASLGIGGLALALAAKDTVSNFFGSVVVFADQPFHVGDLVTLGSTEGTIEEVGMRTTKVRLLDKSMAIIPNQTFTNTTIINHSRRPMRRIKLVIGLTYETTSAQMQTFLDSLRTMLNEHPDIDPDVQAVYFTEYGDSSLNIMIYCFTKTSVWTEFLAAQEDVLLKIMDLAQAQTLEFAFPTRTIYFRDERWQDATQAVS